MRRYVIAAVAIATAWLAATMTANVLIDPQGVFGSELVPVHLNANQRYAAFRDYKGAPERYDAVLFGASRGNAFDRTFLAAQFGARAVVNFSVPFGLLTDHLPALQFLLRDKAARGERLKGVFLLLDADFFGKAPWTNVNIDSFLPPQESGESPLRFWWRYLTAFQFKYWNMDLRRLRATATASAGTPRPRYAAAGLMPLLPLGSLAPPARIPVDDIQELDAPEIRSDLARQLDLLARFVALCRAQDVRLIVAFSPLSRQNVPDVQAPDNARIVDQVARVVPVWDFGRPAWLSERPDLWLDNSHYGPAVATMMMQRVFGLPTSAPADFGRLREP